MAGQRLELDRELTLGRAGCDVTLEDHQISRRHLALRPSGTELGIEDLGSTNGTDVDGQRIAGAVSVGNGAVVQVGSSEFVVEVLAPASEDQPTALASKPAGRPPSVVLAGVVEPAGGLPAWLWSLTTLVDIGLIATAVFFLFYYAV